MYLSLNHASIFLEDSLKKRNILIKNGKIVAISSQEFSLGKILNLQNLWILPGAIDSHVHFRDFEELEKETWITGSKAALKGGITTVLDMPNNYYSVTSLSLLEEKRKLVQKNSFVHFGLFIGISNKNSKEELDLILKSHSYAGTKIYLAESTGHLLCDDMNWIKKMIEKSKRPISFHVENEMTIKKNIKSIIDDSLFEESLFLKNHNKIRSAESTQKTLKELLKIIEKVQGKAPLHFCHISTPKEIDLLFDLKKKDNRISIEVSPHHLFLNDSSQINIPQLLKVNPPLRSEKEQKTLLEFFMQGKIDVLASDHAPHLLSEKIQKDYLKVPSGLPGLETQLPLMLSEMHRKNFSLYDIVRTLSYNPSRIFKIESKGKIDLDYDADMVIINPDEEYFFSESDLETKAKWNPFLNKKLKGKIEATIVSGTLSYWKNEFQKAPVQEIQYHSY